MGKGKQASLRQWKTQCKRNISPKKETIKLQEQFNLNKSKEFMKTIKSRRLRRLKEEMVGNNRQDYTDQANQTNMFKQQWQNKKVTQERQDFQIITYQNAFEVFTAVTMMICFSFTIWLANVEFFFGMNKRQFMSSFVYIAPLGFVILDMLWKGDINAVKEAATGKQLLQALSKPLICIIYLSLKIADVSLTECLLWLILQLPCLYIFYQRTTQFYKSLRVLSLSKKYQYHFKAFDLIFSLMVVAHIVALILFVMAQNGENTTWMTNLYLQDKNALIQYIYSFYFGCTTILTVGYGDIAPKNHIQVFIVSLVEIFGSAIFAYLISQISYNLGTLRKQRQIAEKDLSVLQKCRGYYKIGPQLLIKARCNLLNNKQTINVLKPQEESQLIAKLSEPLRQEVIGNNTLSVVKSSIFFLCRWTKNFQRLVAHSLTSALYAPGELLYQPRGNERIYIIRLGKIDFYRKQQGNKQDAQKVIKSLKVTLDTEVTNNSFGYTAAIGRKPTQLEVVSRDFTSAYYIDKTKFKQCINENPGDWEYYNEISNKIEQSLFPQALEIPQLNSKKLHYNPSKVFLIKKETKHNALGKNYRKDAHRHKKRASKKDMMGSFAMTASEVARVRSACMPSLEEMSSRSSHNQYKSKTSIAQTFKDILMEANGLNFLVKKSQGWFLEQGKEYGNYYPSQNVEAVLRKMEMNVPRVQLRTTTKKLRINTQSSAGLLMSQCQLN